MHARKNGATNIRHVPLICYYGSRTRRGQIGLQVPRQLWGVYGNAQLAANAPS